MTRERWIAVSLAVLGTLATNQAGATLLEELDTSRLTKEAQSVALGQVVSERAVWDPEKQMVFTYVEFKVDQTLKGEPKETVTIRQPGGSNGGIRMIVHGMASFRTGERALVFLRQESDGTPSVVGMAQGKYRIYRSSATGEEMALFRAPRNLKFYTRGVSGRALHVVESPAEKRIPLRDLIGEIQAAVRSETP